MNVKSFLKSVKTGLPSWFIVKASSGVQNERFQVMHVNLVITEEFINKWDMLTELESQRTPLG